MSEAGLDKLAVKQLIETDIEAREVLVLRNAVAALLKLILKLSVLVVQRGEIFVKLVDIGAGLVIELDIARAVADYRRVGSGIVLADKLLYFLQHRRIRVLLAESQITH